MTEADPEEWDAAEQLFDRCDLLCERLRVARAVRQQDAVVPEEFPGIDVVRVDGHRRARADEPSQDRTLAAVVDDRDARSTDVAVDVWLVCRHLPGERATAQRPLPARDRLGLLD